MDSINTLRTIEEIFARYEELGLCVGPVAHHGKAPLIDPKLFSNSAKQMLKWYNTPKYKGCNWGINPAKSGCGVIDVDKRDGGLELWAELSRDVNIRTLTQKSARGGLHFVFRVKEGVKYRKPLSKKGIDFQHNNIIVCFPSKLAEGQQYTWIDESPIQDLPQKFHDIFVASNTENQEPVEFIGIEKYIEKICEQIKTKTLGYDEWVQVGMAIHSSLPTPEGLKLWQLASSGPSFKEGDLENCEYKWNGFSTKGGMTVRSLGFIARELGCETPSMTLEMDKMEFATEKQRIELEAEQNDGWFKQADGRIVCVHKDFILDDLNRQGFFLEQEANPGKIGKLNIDNKGYKTVSFMKPADFALQTATLFFKEYKRDQSGHMKAVYTKVSKLWCESDKRQTYTRIIFSHVDELGALNLWSPLPCTPIKGDVSLFNRLIFEGIANGDVDKGLWLLDWLAHMVQRPHERCSLVPVLIGDQGTGKGMLFDRIMKTILGSYHNTINRSSILKERFNYEQACKFLTFIDEASWRGDREEDGILKNLTGSKQMTVEQKFGGRFAVNNYSRYAIASNNAEAVSIERSNRRYVVFEVNAAFAKLHGFFKAMAEQLEAGTLAQAVFEMLLARDISNFNPHQIVEFGDGQGHQMKVASEGLEAEFWNDVFNQEPKELWVDEKTLHKEAAFEEFIHFAKTVNSYQKNLTKERFWRKTNEFFKKASPDGTRIDSGKKRHYCLLITPNEAQHAFCSTLNIKARQNFRESDFIFSDAAKLQYDLVRDNTDARPGSV